MGVDHEAWSLRGFITDIRLAFFGFWDIVTNLNPPIELGDGDDSWERGKPHGTLRGVSCPSRTGETVATERMDGKTVLAFGP